MLQKIIYNDQRTIMVPAGASTESRTAALAALEEDIDIRKKMYMALMESSGIEGG